MPKIRKAHESTASKASHSANTGRLSTPARWMAPLLAGALGSTLCLSAVQAEPPQVTPVPKAAQIKLNPAQFKAAPAQRTEDVQLTDVMEKLVPSRLVKGDREFDGNGPDITSSVELRVSPDKKKILAKIKFKAVETKHDWSTTEGEWERTVYEAPAGRTIARIEGTVNDDGQLDSATSSSVQFRSVKAGFQILGPSNDFKAFVNKLIEVVNQIIQAEAQINHRSEPTREVEQYREIAEKVKQGLAFLPENDNHVHLKSADRGPVRVFAIVGDTGGPDISDDDNPKDDTRINSIVFKKLRIRFQ